MVDINDTETMTATDAMSLIDLADVETTAVADVEVQIGLSAVDTGSGLEGYGDRELEDTEWFVGHDSQDTMGALVNDADTAVGADAQSVPAVPKSDSDTVTGVDINTTTVVTPPGRIRRWSMVHN